MNTYEDKPKRTTDQLNLWFSKWQGAWMTCAWIRKNHDTYSDKRTYEKEQVAHPNFGAAVDYIKMNYTGAQT